MPRLSGLILTMRSPAPDPFRFPHHQRDNMQKHALVMMSKARSRPTELRASEVVSRARTSIARERLRLLLSGDALRIGIVGAGHIGGTAAKLFVGAGHQVTVSNSRGPESLASLVASLGPQARATIPSEAIRCGDVVLLAVPWRRKEELPAADLFTGKIAIDAMNAYSAVGRVEDLGEGTSSEEVAKRMPKARLVKAFNTMGWKTLETGSRLKGGDLLVIFFAGDDREAKSVVAKLIEEIGFAAIDTGSLREGGRRQQPGSPIYGRPLTAPQARDIL